jgi:ribosome-associated toxin RatA of RatAB toxin-antitoxin module
MGAEPVRRNHFVPGATPADVYAVVVDFAAYPRLFPEFSSTRVLVDGQRASGAADGAKRVRVEFNVKVMVTARYVLDLVCDPAATTVDWTFVEGEVVTASEGSWRFTAEGGGTRVDYAAALEVKAPLPGFVLRKITDAIVSASLPSMFASITREVAARKASAAARPAGP